MVDCAGKELKIGDKVVCSDMRYADLLIGEIIDFTPKKARVRYVRSEYQYLSQKEQLKESYQIFKYSDGDALNMIENALTTDVAPRTETAKEIFAEIEKNECHDISGKTTMYMLFAEEFAELKKKYIGEDTNVPTKTEGATDTNVGNK